MTFYKVQCQSCGKPFDAMSARQCDCLADVRTFRCSHCAACFCRADSEYVNAFWQGAPRELWRRRSSHDGLAIEPRTTAERPLVLVADDVPAVRALATRVVSSMGVRVIVASNGGEAVKLALEHKPDMVILDAMMPQLDGREAARVIRGQLPKTRIIVLTGVYRDLRYRVEALRDGIIDEYLVKPITPKELRSVITKHASSPASIPVLRERRLAQRVRALPPIDARVDGKQAFVIDVSTTGIRIAHEPIIAAAGSEVALHLDWGGRTVRLRATVAWSHAQSADLPVDLQLHQTGLHFVDVDADLRDTIREIVETNLGRALAAMKASAGSILTHRAARGSKDKQQPPSYVRHELAEGHWTTAITSDRTQPPNGFTARADLPTPEVEMLRATFASADEGGRALIRTLAELSSDAEN